MAVVRHDAVSSGSNQLWGRLGCQNTAVVVGFGCWTLDGESLTGRPRRTMHNSAQSSR